MGLIKSLPLLSGVTPGYTRITGISYDRIQRLIQINAALYLDQAHAHNGAEPVVALQPVVIEGDAAEAFVAMLHDLVAPAAYDALRDANPALSDAVES